MHATKLSKQIFFRITKEVLAGAVLLWRLNKLKGGAASGVRSSASGSVAGALRWVLKKIQDGYMRRSVDAWLKGLNEFNLNVAKQMRALNQWRDTIAIWDMKVYKGALAVWIENIRFHKMFSELSCQVGVFKQLYDELKVRLCSNRFNTGAALFSDSPSIIVPLPRQLNTVPG